MLGSAYEYLKDYELYERELSLGNEFYRNERNYSKLGRNGRDNIRNILLSLPFFRIL